MNKPNALLEGLAHIRKRPLMYFSDQVPAVVNFLEGFKTACLMMNPLFDYDSVYRVVLHERNWEYSAVPIWQQMQERGMDDAEIIAELLTIHQKIWTRLNLDTAQAVENKANN